MTDLELRLERLGLSQYFEAFVAEGFDTWKIVLDITEADLSSLNVKLGHRRKLQRAIAEFGDRPLPTLLHSTTSVDGPYRSDESATEHRPNPRDARASSAATNTKRRYRRHPRPDGHAPERAPSAYVIFSNQVRETLKGRGLSFTEIAKVVGEKWQVLPADEREACERQANSAKEKYYADLAEYKKTPQYEAYQSYLEDFKAKHAAPPKDKASLVHRSSLRNTVAMGVESKRTKLETETGISTRSSSHDQSERTTGRRISSVNADAFPGQHQLGSSSPVGPARLPPGPTFSSKPTSPAVHSLSGLNSPRLGDHYSSLSVSPCSATLHKESLADVYQSNLGRNTWGQSDAGLPYLSSAHGPLPAPPLSNTPHPAAYAPDSQPPVDLVPRRSMREMPRLPFLTRADTALSSDSAASHSGVTNFIPVLPSIDAPKSMRTLPAPVSTLGAAPFPFDHLPSQLSSPLQHMDTGNASSLAALLKAGELARVADSAELDRIGSS